MEGKSLIRALKRIQRDLDELEFDPLDGVGIARVNPDDNLTFVVNMRINDGIYTGILLQFQMTIPQSFPIFPPEMLMYPGQPFGHEFHHHVYDGQNGFKRFCVDILGNAIMSTSNSKSGWSPAYTFKTLFMQVQNFLGDPDMSNPPGTSHIEELKKKLESYTREFINEMGEKVKHIYSMPYPSLGIAKVTTTSFTEDDRKLIYLKNALTCYHLKTDYISDRKMVLGYPLMITKTRNGLFEISPIPELLSYEGYITQIQTYPNKLEDFFGVNFKTAMGEYYNYWLPIYIDEEHYQTNKGLILNSISVCKNGISGKKEYDFQPLDCIEIMPPLLNKMIIFLLNGKNHMSNAAIEAYCHYIMLFNRLCEDYPEVRKYIKSKLYSYQTKPIDKTNCPDLGNLIVLYFFGNIEIEEKLMHRVLDEFFTRHILWLFAHKTTNRKHEIEPLFQHDKNMKIAYCLDRFFTKNRIAFQGDILLMNHREYINKNKGRLYDSMKYRMDRDLDELRTFLNRFNFFRKMTACTKEIKAEIMKRLTKDHHGNNLLLYTYKAALKFINVDYINRLRKNYCVLEELENVNFINELNEAKSKILNYRDLVTEIGCRNYFQHEDDIYYMMKYLKLSDEKGYTTNLAPISVINYYKLN
jgi:ubiquitin-protein ligase